jgi:hypothetical protein
VLNPLPVAFQHGLSSAAHHFVNKDELVAVILGYQAGWSLDYHRDASTGAREA